MADYPNALPVFSNPNSGDKLNAPSHSQIEKKQNDEIAAICQELGTNVKGIYADLKARLDALPGGHSHSNLAILDLITEAFTTALKTAYDDAVTKAHEHLNITVLDAIQEAFTTALKSSYDSAVLLAHSHINITVLNNIQESLTTALKSNYDTAYSLAHVFGSDNETASSIATIITGQGAETPLDADEFPFYKIVGTILKKVTWATIKTTLQAVWDALYVPLSRTINGYALTSNVILNASDVGAYTQEEVNSLIAGANFDFYFSDTAEGIIPNYNLMYDLPTGQVESSITVNGVSADNTLIKEFITETTQPDFTVLSEGNYQVHVHALVNSITGYKRIRLYWKLYQRTSLGVETLLITSEESDLCIATEQQHDIHGNLLTETVLATDDRLVIKIYANVEDAGANPDVTINLEGNTDSRLQVLTTISAFDNRYEPKNTNIQSHISSTSNPHSVTKTQVGLGNVDNKSEATIITDVKADTDVASAISLKHASGSDAETTTTVGSLINGATEKTTPIDADMLGLMDSADTNKLKKFSWANLKSKFILHEDLLDYSETSTIVGFSSFTTKKIYIFRRNKKVDVYYNLDGTSNATNLTFTLPYAIKTGLIMYWLAGLSVDNGGLTTSPSQLSLSASTVNVDKTAFSAAWTNSGQKVIYGHLSYITD